MSVLLNALKSVVLKPMGHNAVSPTVTHKYKSTMGYWVHYQKMALKSQGHKAMCIHSHNTAVDEGHVIYQQVVPGNTWVYVLYSCIKHAVHKRFYCIPFFFVRLLV